MVSTRGVKFKFTEGEKVLCYEPDLSKAKVLYDSKVLEVNDTRKDSRGRKSVQYLIHFQGWNSSWDRYVCEDYVLKDIEENRQLQRDLAEKAQLQFGTYNYLYRKDHTKRRRKPSELNGDLEPKKLRDGDTPEVETPESEPLDGDVSNDSSEHSHSQHENEPSENEESSQEAEFSEGDVPSQQVDIDDDDKVPLQLSDSMKRLLELDYDLIKNQNRLVNLPAQPNVVSILEGYVKHYAVTLLCGVDMEEHQWRFRPPLPIPNMSTQDMEEARRVLNICKEMVDGVRIYFDFTLKGLLLYNPECEQFETHRNLPPRVTIKEEHMDEYLADLGLAIKQELEEETYNNSTQPEDITQPCNSNNHAASNGDNDSGGRKRRLRSYRSEPTEPPRQQSNGFPKSQHDEDIEDNCPLAQFKQELANNALKSNSTVASTSSRCSSPNGQCASTTTNPSTRIVSTLPKTNMMLNQILAWQLVPDSMYSEVPSKPSLVYGAIHLARLFVKLPKLLYETNMPEQKLKVLQAELDVFLHYLEDHSEWFGESYYKDIERVNT